MKTSANKLLDELRVITLWVIERGRVFEQLPTQTMLEQPSPESWNIVQCLEHLNLYGDFYLPEIESRALKAGKVQGDYEFRSGILGNYSANSMLPKDDKVRKMKTFKDKDPSKLDLQCEVVFARFFKQQERFLELLESCRSVDLNRTKTSTTLKYLSFKLGDTLRFVIYHHKRHIWQANNILKALNQEQQEKELSELIH